MSNCIKKLLKYLHNSNLFRNFANRNETGLKASENKIFACVLLTEIFSLRYSAAPQHNSSELGSAIRFARVLSAQIKREVATRCSWSQNINPIP